jgi:hypothetical protein
MVACLVIMLSALLVNDADGVTGGPRPRPLQYHAYAVKGQTIELEVLIPGAQSVLFQVAGKQISDFDPPFNLLLATTDVPPGQYLWHTAYMPVGGCCNLGGPDGSIRIYPLPKVRAFKASALVVAGTAHVVGLVVSKVAENRTVRAWGFQPKSKEGVFPLPMRLRRERGSVRIYRFAHGFTLNAGKKTEIDVEVAPLKRVMRHGEEVRGRLARLWLRRNRRTGETRAHQSVFTACTTVQGRKGDSPQPLPGPQSCINAPAATIVSVPPQYSPCFETPTGCTAPARRR